MDRNRRILVVDDNKQILFILRDTLARLGRGYETVTAQNAHDAMTEIKKRTFELLITDLEMPDTNGRGLTEAVKALNPGIVVVWITGHGCRRVRAQAARLRVYRCLEKPLDIRDIPHIVREVLGTAEG